MTTVDTNLPPLMPADADTWAPEVRAAADRLIALGVDGPREHAALWLCLRIPDQPWVREIDAMVRFHRAEGWPRTYDVESDGAEQEALIAIVNWIVDPDMMIDGFASMAPHLSPASVALLADALRITAGLPTIEQLTADYRSMITHNAKAHNLLRKDIRRIATHAAAEDRTLGWISNALIEALDDPTKRAEWTTGGEPA